MATNDKPKTNPIEAPKSGFWGTLASIGIFVLQLFTRSKES